MLASKSCQKQVHAAARGRHAAVVMAAAASSGPAAVASCSGGASASKRRITAKECFDDMCTMLGGVSQGQHTGYAGQWRTWDVTPAAAEAAGTAGPVLIDTSTNIRLWRLVDPATNTLQQSNLYQAPDKMAGPSTRFAPYLAGNTMSGRPDGYGLRVWNFTPDNAMVDPDASTWSSKPGSAESAMRVLTVPHSATTIINGAMPSGFEEGHNPRFWVLEFIIKEASSNVRRWASMNWYELGELVVDRSINEDVHSLHDEPDGFFVDPNNITFEPRREGTLPSDVEEWVAAHDVAQQQGSATVFEYDDELQLTMSKRPCSWSNEVLDLAGSAEAGGVQQQAYPDWSYCRVPKSLRQLVASGQSRAVFEAGTVLRDGSLARWLLEYDTGGLRLLRSATFEMYPGSSSSQKP